MPTVPRAEIIVVPTGRIWVDEFSTPSHVIFFSVSTTHMSELLGASATENHGILPFQYLTTDVFGVPPPMISTISAKGWTSHPFGISPSSESSKESGKRSARGLGRPESRPSAPAPAGPKLPN